MKKAIFQQIIQDNIRRPFSNVKSRIGYNIPTDISKTISMIGPRRSGKTYILFDTIIKLRKTIESHRIIYINFEDDRLFPLELADMEIMLKGYYELYPQNKKTKVWFFFDEIQEVPNWEKFIRRVIDTENCNLYITGSSAHLLSRDLATSMRGRTLPYEVFPLSFKEFLFFNNVHLDLPSTEAEALALYWLRKYMKQGGFPELVFLPDDQHLRTINEYMDLMLFKDLAQRFSIRNPAMVKILLKHLITNLAKPASINKLNNDFKSQGYECNKNTLHEYMHYLEEVFSIFKVEKWSLSLRARAINPSKYYLIDPSYKTAMSVRDDIGRVMENLVFLELKRKGIHPFYFEEKGELDFYHPEGLSINVCFDMTDPMTRAREIKGLQNALDISGQNEALILSWDQREDFKMENKKINIMPLYLWLIQ